MNDLKSQIRFRGTGKIRLKGQADNTVYTNDSILALIDNIDNRLSAVPAVSCDQPDLVEDIVEALSVIIIKFGGRVEY